MKNKLFNSLVPLNIAVKLKNIGFNKSTMFGFYSGEDDCKLNIYEDVNLDYKLYLNDIELQDYNHKAYEVSVPFWTDVLEWFREENLIGTIEYDDFYFDDKDCYYAYRIKNKLGEIIFYSVNYSTYETYEEAREALIEKLIEIYTNKKDE